MGTGSAPYLSASVSSTVILVKAGKVALASFFLYNPSNAVAFLRLYDAVAIADVTNGTTVPNYVLTAKTTDLAQGSFSKPLHFTKGLCMVACTTFADTGTTAPSSALNVSFGLSS